MIHQLRDEMDCLDALKGMVEETEDDSPPGKSEESKREEFREEVRAEQKAKNKGGRPRKHPIPNSDATPEEIRKALETA